jgi:hypothetical protein
MKYRKIFIIHNGKANYPEIQAYKNYFGNKYEVKDITIKELKRNKKIHNTIDEYTILWYIMGFYPKKIKAGFVIHDYRSLSIGKFAKFKNFIKKVFNQKSNLRIFLNEYVANEFKFKDNIPFIFLDMGVPDYIFEIKKDPNIEEKYDFIYVGEISKERESDKMIINFVKKYGTSKTLLLVGKYEKFIYEKFYSYHNIIFTGKIEQKEVFKLIRLSKYCLNFIPNKYPYDYQTSTKLLEYAALGKKIISTLTKANIQVAKKYKINTLFVNNFEFPEENELKKIKPNIHINAKLFSWENIIKSSGIERYL